jgi:hypothetical protein
MRMILVVGLIVASAVVAERFTPSNAQAPDVSRTYRFTGNPDVSLQIGRGEQRPNGIYFQSMTLALGDVVVTADDGLVTTIDGNTEIQFGANTRMRIPAAK